MRKTMFALSFVLAAICAFIIGGTLYNIGASPAASVIVSAVIFTLALVAAFAEENKNALYMSCGRIASGQTASCSDVPTAGTEVYCWIMNRDEIDKTSTQFDVTNPLIMTDLIMNSGKYVYKFEGYKNSIDPEDNMNKGKIINSWIHGPNRLVLLPPTPDAEKNLENLSKSNVCMIIANKKSGVDGIQKFKFKGWDVGLEMTVAKRKASDADTQGMWDVTLSSPEGEFEGHVPFTLWDTNESTTLAQITALQETT